MEKMTEKKVSVVVTCYNLEQEIGRCLESLQRQTYTDLEIIVVDDGSKDSSFSVIQKYAAEDSRILPVYQENSGPSAARNHGIDLSTGEYLLFIDGDDYVADTYVQHFMEVAQGCDMVIGALRYVYPDGSTACESETAFRCDKAEYVEKYYTQSVRKRTIFGPVNKLYRSAVIKDNNVRFREGLSIREDGMFVLDVLEHVKTLCGMEYAEYFYLQSAPNASLVSKFHEDEKEINAQFFQMLVDVIGKENLRPEDVRVIYPMFLNMDISSIRKLYYSESYSLKKGLRYIRGILKDETFCRAREELSRVDSGLAKKYYRPLPVVHIINYLAVKRRR